MAMADDVKAPEGLTGPDEKVSVSWLILQRLDDLKGQIADVRSQVTDVRQEVAQLRESTETRFNAMERRWSWSIGLIAVMALGLLAKLLIHGA